jgi:hypothetical protein
MVLKVLDSKTVNYPKEDFVKITPIQIFKYEFINIQKLANTSNWVVQLYL